MSHPNPSTALARVIVDEMAQNGVSLVVISPGSRSAALAIAAAEHPDVDTRVIIDERSAAFHALGVARATGHAVAVLSTSGTAPANYYPAVVEADMACLPLVVISADRPAEMRGVGANQTIDQVELYGRKVRLFTEIAAPDSSSDLNLEWRTAVSGALGAAVDDHRPGPVHLNVSFREPTVPLTDDGRTRGEAYPFDTPRVETTHTGPDETSDPLPVLDGGRGLVIAGDGVYDRMGLLKRAGALGWPVLATALSGMRGEDVISTYHHLLAYGVPSGLVPEVVVAVGAIGPSVRLETLIGTAGTRIRIDHWGRLIDPARNAQHIIRGDVTDLLERVGGAADGRWWGVWRQADRDCREELRAKIGAHGSMTGASVAEAMNELAWGSLVVSSSLPIREIDAHLSRPGPVFANRGASGIDGLVSTALGVASVIPGTLAVTGDLALLHDSNGFLGETEIDLCIVVIDNDGGGLFDALPQAAHAPQYERLFVTPPARDLAKLAAFHGLAFSTVSDRVALANAAGEALDRGGLSLIRVPVNRALDRRLRAQLGD